MSGATRQHGEDGLGHSPALANAACLLGLAVMLTTFATSSLWPVILGGLLFLAGGLWAGVHDDRPGDHR